jgi:predicted RNA binding protein YcfA (HicA-like mRNA interferase family)
LPRIIPIPWQDFERILKKTGCLFDRQEGDHRIYNRAGLRRPIVFPADSNVPVFIIKNNLRTLNLSRQEYFDLLGEI